MNSVPSHMPSYNIIKPNLTFFDVLVHSKYYEFSKYKRFVSS